MSVCVSMIKSSSCVLFSRMTFLTAVFAIKSSYAGIKPPDKEGIKRKEKMQKRKNQMPCFRGCYCRRHSFVIAHLSNHPDIHVLPEHRSQSLMKRKSIGAHLSLINDAFIRSEHVFNRVFNRNDMFRALFVNNIQHGYKRCCLAVPRGADHKKKSLLFSRKFS